MNRIVMLVMMFFLGGIHLFSQEPSFRNFTVDDGLPSDNVYYSLQDHKGFMWFATEVGVSRFDGYKFENFTTEDGLSDNEVFQIHEDSQKRLWFLTSNGKPCYYKEGKFYTHRNDSALAKIERKAEKISRLGHLSAFFEDSQQRIWFGYRWAGIARIDPDGTILHESCEDLGRADPRAVRFIWENDKKEILILSSRGVYKWQKGYQLEPVEVYRDYKLGYLRAAELEGDRIIATSGTIFRTIDKNSGKILNTQKGLASDGSIVFCGSLGKDIWIGTFYGARVYRIPQNRLLLNQTFMTDKIVSSIYQDREGNYWITTQKSGLFFSPSLQVLSYSPADEGKPPYISVIKRKSKNELWVGMDDFHYGIFNGKSFMFDKIPNTYYVGRGRMTKFVDAGPQNTWFINENIIVQKKGEKMIPYSLSGKDLAFLPDGEVLLASGSGLMKVPETLLNEFSGTHDITAHDEFWTQILKGLVSRLGVKEIQIHPESGIPYLATLDGLYTLINDEATQVNLPGNLPQNQVNSIYFSPEGTLWAGYFGEGLLRIAPDGSTKWWKTENGLASNFVKKIVGTPEGLLYIGTLGGLTILTPDGNGGYNTSVLTKRNGLISEQVNDILVENDTVTVATSEGLSIFNAKHIFEPRPTPPIQITRVIIDEVAYSPDELPELKPGKKKISIEYRGLTYRYSGQVRYRYKMSGLDPEWVETDLNRLEFPSLPPENYDFRVQATAPYSSWPATFSQISFTVPRTIYQTFWFWILFILAGFALLTLLFFLRLRAIKEKAALRQRATENRQTALRSQMNPHFIFNSLNSLQRFIIRNDTDAAYDYTAKFGRLVRQVLEHSKHNEISLQEDLDTLRLYLELESIRFDHNFQFEIEIDPEISPSVIAVPPTLIQPFAENAIWHGLMPLEGNRNLWIRIRKDQQFIIIEIEDNGVGRAFAAKKNKEIKREGESTGIEVTEERLKNLYKKAPSFPILQFTDKQNPTGTIVTIRIPIKKFFV